MNNFLKQINILLAALKPEDKEKYEKMQIDAEAIFKVKSRYDHLFGSDDRYYIESKDLENNKTVLDYDHRTNLRKINMTLRDFTPDYRILNEDSYLNGKANKINKNTKEPIEPQTDPKNLKSIDKLLTEILDYEIKDYYLLALEKIKPYISNKEVLEVLNNDSINKYKKISALYKICKPIKYDIFVNLENQVDITAKDLRVFQYYIEDLYYIIRLKAIHSTKPSMYSSNNLMVVISRNSEDIAGMSTDRRWTSCMLLPGYDKEKKEGGCFNSHLAYDIKLGTLVAYLIKKDDKNIENPFARIAIKPLFDINKKNNKILDIVKDKNADELTVEDKKVIENFKNEEFFVYLRPEERAYSDGSVSSNTIKIFQNIVLTFCNKHNENAEGMFEVDDKLYNDSGTNIKIVSKDEKVISYLTSLAQNLIDNNHDFIKMNFYSLDDVINILYKWYVKNNKDINNWLFKNIEKNNIKYIERIPLSEISNRDKKVFKAEEFSNVIMKNEDLLLSIDKINNCKFENVKEIMLEDESTNSTFINCVITYGKFKNCIIKDCLIEVGIYIYSEKFKDYMFCKINTDKFLEIEQKSDTKEHFRINLSKEFKK